MSTLSTLPQTKARDPHSLSLEEIPESRAAAAAVLLHPSNTVECAALAKLFALPFIHQLNDIMLSFPHTQNTHRHHLLSLVVYPDAV